jgi:hypothetical protein
MAKAARTRAVSRAVVAGESRPKRPAQIGEIARAAAVRAPGETGAAAVGEETAEARRHLLSLSFLRDGDEFLARLETDGGQITELKNRSLDQLLTLVAGELEDILE